MYVMFSCGVKIICFGFRVFYYSFVFMTMEGGEWEEIILRRLVMLSSLTVAKGIILARQAFAVLKLSLLDAN